MFFGVFLHKMDLETKKKHEDAENEEKFKHKLEELQTSQNGENASHKSPRTKKLAGKTARSSPLKHAKPLTKHGGIVGFKPPAQAGPSGVEFFEKNGENFTTLRQLQSALRKKKGSMDKTS